MNSGNSGHHCILAIQPSYHPDFTWNTNLTLWPGNLAVQVLESSCPPSVMPRTLVYQEASPSAPVTLITRSAIRPPTIICWPLCLFCLLFDCVHNTLSSLLSAADHFPSYPAWLESEEPWRQMMTINIETPRIVIHQL